MNETTIPQTEAKKADENNGPRLTQDGDTERATKVTAEQHVNSLTTSVQQPANQLSRKKEEGGARKLPGLQSSQEEVNTNSLTSTVTSSASVHVPAASTVTLSRAADTQKRNAVAQSWPSVNNNVTNASHSNPGIQSAGPRPVVMGRLSSAVSPMKTVSLVTSRQSPSLSYSPRPIAMKPMPVQQAVAVRQLNLVSSSTPVRTVSAQVVPVLSVVPTTQSLTNIQSLSSIQAPATGATTHTSNPVVILAPHSSGGVTVLPAGTIFHPGTTSTANKSDPSKAVVKTTTAVMIASTSTVASGSQTGSVSLPLGVRHIVISCEQQQYLQRQGHHIATVVTPQQLRQSSKVAIPQNVQLATKQASIIQPSRTLVHIQPKPSQIQQVPGAAVQVTQSLANIAAATLISVAPSQVAGTLSVPAGTHAVAAGSTAVLPVVTIANSSASEQKIVDPLIDAQISAKPRKKCNCSRSQCLKLYCECFANGEFCDYTCNCQNCRNTLEHEDERSKAIKQCLDRNPHAFHPKIGKSRAENAHSRSHIRGCNCKRSGCLKNYCECYEAKVLCTNLCRCVGCKNFEESPERKTLMHLADAAEVRKQQQRAAKAHLSSQIDNIPTRLPAASTSERLPFMFITPDIIEATCKCLLTKAEEAEESVVPQNAERAVLQEFGRCLTQIIQAANKANRQQSL